MNKIILISILVIVLIGGFLIFYNPKPENWESKTDDQAVVSVTVTPIDISPQSKEWKFNIVMDTHSIELDQDMMKVAVLIGDQSKEYKPINWEGPVGGHHREGIITFNRIIPVPKSVELKISGVGDVMRSFTW